MNKYSGILQEYYETGMECMGLILHDDRGLTPNPEFDATKTGYPHDVEFWHSLEWAIFFNGGERIHVMSKDGTEIEWEGTLTKNRAAMAECEYRFSFLPKEVSKETWLNWFREERKATVWTKEKVPTEREKPELKL